MCWRMFERKGEEMLSNLKARMCWSNGPLLSVLVDCVTSHGLGDEGMGY